MNMKKEYRHELRTLARAKRKIQRDALHHAKTVCRQVATLRRTLERGEAACAKEIARIDRRTAILEGRLS